MSVERIEDEASLRHEVLPVVGSATLSALTALTESLTLTGLVSRLTAAPVPKLAGIDLSSLAKPPLIITLAVATLVLSGLSSTLIEHVAARWSAHRRHDLIRAYREADFPTQASYAPTTLGSVLEQIDTATLSITTLISLSGNIVRTLIYLGIAFVASARASAIAALAGVLLLVALRLLARQTRRLNRSLSHRTIDLATDFGEMVMSARELHLLNRWNEIDEGLTTHVGALRRLRFVARSVADLVPPLFVLGIVLIGLAVAEWGARAGNTAELATSGVLLIRALGAVQTCQLTYQQYNDAHPYREKVFSVIGELRAARRLDRSSVPATATTLRASGLSIGYGNQTVVADFDGEFAGPGGIAIIGPSGSGKSTTLLAMSGLIRPTDGQVTLGHAPLDELPRDQLGRMIGLLPQDPKLIRRSLRSNLARPETALDDERLLEIIRDVGLTATFEGFKAGLDTSMGRGEQGFSGGELQRLGLARLMVNRPNVWLLDEPTSALDRHNAARVGALIAEAIEHHLVIVVTHRPELLEHCQHVIYMENGTIRGQGSLHEVAEAHEFVRRMLAAGLQ